MSDCYVFTKEMLEKCICPENTAANCMGLAEAQLEISSLRHQNQKLQHAAEAREWLCEECCTLYPGPPAEGFDCVMCPKCNGTTLPRKDVEIRALKLENEKLCDEVQKLRGALENLAEYADSFIFSLTMHDKSHQEHFKEMTVAWIDKARAVLGELKDTGESEDSQ